MGRDEPTTADDPLRVAKQALVQSEAINRTIVASIPQRLFLKDCASVYLAVNEAYAASLGCEPADIVGKDDFAFFPAELAEKYRADDREVMEIGTGPGARGAVPAQGRGRPGSARPRRRCATPPAR